VKQTIENGLPPKADFLKRYDRFDDAVQGIADMPDNTVDLLFRFLRQNEGKLSKRARENEFKAFSDAEVELAQNACVEAFPTGVDAGG